VSQVQRWSLAKGFACLPSASNYSPELCLEAMSVLWMVISWRQCTDRPNPTSVLSVHV